MVIHAPWPFALLCVCVRSSGNEMLGFNVFFMLLSGLGLCILVCEFVTVQPSPLRTDVGEIGNGIYDTPWLVDQGRSDISRHPAFPSRVS